MNWQRGSGLIPVSERGATAGSVLCGSGRSNRGIRLRILQEQARGEGGSIQGGFVILDVGDNMHSAFLRPLLNRMTNAAEVLGIIRQQHAGCINVANRNILVAEQNRGAAQPLAERPPQRQEGVASDPDHLRPNRSP